MSLRSEGSEHVQPVSTSPEAPADHRPRGAPVTRERLLQATHELLLERAGAAPSLSQVCERAKVQTGMVRYCFGNKANMLEALVERIRLGVEADLERLAASDLDPEQQLRRHVEAVVRNFVRFPYGTRLSEQLRSGLDHREEITHVFGDVLIPFYERLLAAGRISCGWRDMDPRLLFTSIAGMADYVSGARRLFPELDEQRLVERFTGHTVELLLDGIGGGGPPGQPHPASRRAGIFA